LINQEQYNHSMIILGLGIIKIQQCFDEHLLSLVGLSISVLVQVNQSDFRAQVLIF